MKGQSDVNVTAWSQNFSVNESQNTKMKVIKWEKPLNGKVKNKSTKHWSQSRGKGLMPSNDESEKAQNMRGQHTNAPAWGLKPLNKVGVMQHACTRFKALEWWKPKSAKHERRSHANMPAWGVIRMMKAEKHDLLRLHESVEPSEHEGILKGPRHESIEPMLVRLPSACSANWAIETVLLALPWPFLPSFCALFFLGCSTLFCLVLACVYVFELFYVERMQGELFFLILFAWIPGGSHFVCLGGCAACLPRLCLRTSSIRCSS